MVSHCCFPAFAAGQMPVLRTVVVFVSIQLPSVGTGVIVCVVFVCVISAAVFGLVLFIAFVAADCDEFLLVDVLPCLKAWDSSINAMLLVRVSERLRPWQYSCLGCLTPCFHARPRPGRI